MVKKAYFNDDAELAITLTKENQFLIEIESGDISEPNSYQSIELNVDDIKELIKDLQNYINNIKSK